MTERTRSDVRVISLCERREGKRHERGRMGLLRVRNVSEPLRSMIAQAEVEADTAFYGACNAYRSYAQ